MHTETHTQTEMFIKFSLNQSLHHASFSSNTELNKIADLHLFCICMRFIVVTFWKLWNITHTYTNKYIDLNGCILILRVPGKWFRALVIVIELLYNKCNENIFLFSRRKCDNILPDTSSAKPVSTATRWNYVTMGVPSVWTFQEVYNMAALFRCGIVLFD